MPITQDRMLNLIESAEVFRDGLSQINSEAARVSRLEAQGLLSTKDAFEQLCQACMYMVHHRHYTNITMERVHFKHASGRNERAKRQMKQLRQYRGGPGSGGTRHKGNLSQAPLEEAANSILRSEFDAWNAGLTPGTESITEADPQAAKPEDFESGDIF